MERRTLLKGLAGALLLPPSLVVAQSARHRVLENGVANPVTQSFEWTNGGGAPLRLTPLQALTLPRVQSVIPTEAAERLLAHYNEGKGAWNWTVEQDSRDDFMISAQGRIEHKVVAKVNQWRREASRRAMVVYYTDPRTGNQWRVSFYEVCRNIGVTTYGSGGPAVCICEGQDVCWS